MPRNGAGAGPSSRWLHRLVSPGSFARCRHSSHSHGGHTSCLSRRTDGRDLSATHAALAGDSSRAASFPSRRAFEASARTLTVTQATLPPEGACAPLHTPREAVAVNTVFAITRQRATSSWRSCSDLVGAGLVALDLRRGTGSPTIWLRARSHDEAAADAESASRPGTALIRTATCRRRQACEGPRRAPATRSA
jgi:hypothetical protein